MRRLLILLLLVVLAAAAGFRPISVLAQGVPGDANGDGHVDESDFDIWWSNYRQNVTGASNGDFDNSGYVDGLDFMIWLKNYGK